jgi:hypothetical protein
LSSDRQAQLIGGIFNALNNRICPSLIPDEISSWKANIQYKID